MMECRWNVGWNAAWPKKGNGTAETTEDAALPLDIFQQSDFTMV
jgi:hypothetical protein